MAGPSNPQLPAVDNYDVFLSFRGPDTRNGFTDHLYHGLKDAGIRVFLDEHELTPGERLDEELPQAIDNSRIYIPVLSETYASSKWCLRELERMVRNKESESEGKKEILPVFYRVTTDDVKLRTDLYQNQLAAHAITTEVEEWKEALQRIPELQGWELPSSRLSDAEVCRLIKERVSTILKVKHQLFSGHANVFQSSRWKGIMDEIVTSLKDDRINVIGLYGMGGVGKTTMINEVRHKVVKEGLFNEVPKAVVTKDVDIPRIQEEIAHELCLKLENRSPNIRADQLRQRLLQKKTVLIILDDLWEKLDLEKVGIPSSSSSSSGGNDQVQIKLLLTSRHKSLLSDKMASQKLVHLDVLKDEDAKRMFRSAVGDRFKSIKEQTTNEIIRRCGGLPIVIMTIAGALKNKDQDEWEKTLNHLDNDDVLKKLKVSYEYLPSEESQQLFLICGIIRDPLIKVTNLLKYTYGLGLYEGNDICTLTAAATELEKLLFGLKAASMLLKSDDSRYVKIHDHMRELAVKIVKECRHEWAHFTLRAVNINRKFKEVSKLELLFSYCESEGNSQLQVPDSFFKGMKKLYVLEFTNLRGALSLPPQTTQLDHLGNLGTLCLHKCSLTSNISMIGELKRLLILSFRGSNIRKLPIQLRELTALRMLDLSDCKELKQIEPNVLGSLIMLEELNMENSFSNWEIDQEGDAPPSNARLIELNSMSRLSNVSIRIPRTSMLPKECRLFSSKLTMYQIILGRSQDNGYDRFSDYKFSRVLMLKFDSPDILQQDWVQATLQMAEFLYLEGRLDGKCESIGELCVKGFECLKDLNVRGCPSIRYIVSSNCGSFRTLESLFLEDLENLEKLCEGLPGHEEVFSKLKLTEIQGCNKLTHLFDFPLLKGDLSSQLEKITVKDCKEIQSIVIDEDDKKEDVVTLFKLRELVLKNLHKFSSFCKQPRTPSKALFTGKKVAFPHLESLDIWHLNELEDIWHHNDPPAELGKPRSLSVRSCNKLVRVINSNVLMRLQHNLESLRIDLCELMEQVFDVEDRIISEICSSTDQVLFPRLKILKVWDCDSMRTIVGGKNSKPTQLKEAIEMKNQVLHYPMDIGQRGGPNSTEEMFTFPCLRLLSLEDLRNLDRFYSSSGTPFGFNFPSLETLEIEMCPGVTTLFTQRPNGLVEAGEHDSDGVGAAFFGYCHKLDESIPNITCLVIGYCDNLKQVVAEEADNEKGGEDDLREITFNHLKKLTLDWLKRLESFSSVNNNNLVLNFPSLEELTIENCPKMRIFSNGVLTTPKLHQLWDYSVSPIQLCGGDLNTAIQKIYREQQVSTSSVVSDSQAQLFGDPNTNIQELDTEMLDVTDVFAVKLLQ